MALPAGFVLEQSSTLPPGFSLEENAPPPAGDYRAEALRKGLASTPAMVAGLGALVGESSAGRGLIELIQALRNPSQPEPMRSPGEVYSSADLTNNFSLVVSLTPISAFLSKESVQ